MKVAAALEKAEEKARRNQFTTGQAAKLLNEILQDIGQDKVESHTCRAWLTEWLQSREGTTAASTLAKYRQVTKAFLDHLGGRGDLDVAAITVRDVREFRDKLRAAGRTPQTVNRLLRKNLAIAFNKAKRLGLIAVNRLMPLSRSLRLNQSATFSPRNRLRRFSRPPTRIGAAQP